MNTHSIRAWPLLAACALTFVALAACQPAATPAASSHTGIDHSAHGSSESNAPIDVQFIDGMIVHHQEAIDMANDAKKQAARPEILALADAILKTQQAEIDQMRTWRAAWYPDAPASSGMNMDMGPMSVAPGDAPYDIRFIDAMIPHHEGAVAMAKAIREKTARAELKTLADAIVVAQTTEIEQMRSWRTAWTQ
jgi:uncharacterized protein (DUF305 family)